MKQALTIPETFLGIGYTRDRARLPLEVVRVPVPRPAADQNGDPRTLSRILDENVLK
jgi:hypothetical protein